MLVHVVADDAHDVVAESEVDVDPLHAGGGEAAATAVALARRHGRLAEGERLDGEVDAVGAVVHGDADLEMTLRGVDGRETQVERLA